MPRSVGKPSVPCATLRPLPRDQGFALCTPRPQLPKDDGWLNEIKFDGYRLLVWKAPSGIRLVTRGGHDWADRLPQVCRWFADLPAREAVIDGELVALLPSGASSFPRLQAALAEGQDGRLHFYAFDLLALDGWDLRGCTLRERKRRLHALHPQDGWTGRLRYSDHFAGPPADLFQLALRNGLEGIICKRDRPYRAGRSQDWIKVKAREREEMVVLGWTPPRASRTGIGALHVGYHDAQGRLHYAGAVGTGFSEQALATWRNRLEAIAAPPPAGMLLAGEPIDVPVAWVEQKYVIEVAFTAWSGAGRLRQAVYLGLREDKSPHEVVRDPADAGAERRIFTTHGRTGTGPKRRPVAVPPRGPHASA